MDYYAIYKTDKNVKICEKGNFRGGYRFVKKTIITLYNRDMMDYILTKKINKNLKDIITLYLACERGEDEDGEACATLIAKTELLKRVFFENYAPFLSKNRAEDYINKFEKLENKIGNLPSKKRVM